MGTKKTTTAAAKTTKTAKTKAERLPRKSVSLTANNERLTIVASERKDGTFRSMAIHRIGAGKDATNVRGMIETHASFVAAVERADALVENAVKIGWTKKAARAPKPTFSALPVPGKAA